MTKLTKNTAFKALTHLWLKEKQAMVTQSTYAGFLLIAAFGVVVESHQLERRFAAVPQFF